jgi:hypothetical protein
MTLRAESRRLEKKLNGLRSVRLRTFSMWSETSERLLYNPEWAIEPSDNTHNATISVPNFAERSPSGSGEWMAPWNVRWSVPRK